VVDAHTIMRDGLQALLSAEADYELVGTRSDGESAIQAAESLRPDIVLMGLSAPGAGDVEALARIKTKFPEISVVALTFQKEDKYIRITLGAGAAAILLVNCRNIWRSL
jgi:two-component system response regulator NreC